MNIKYYAIFMIPLIGLTGFYIGRHYTLEEIYNVSSDDFVIVEREVGDNLLENNGKNYYASKNGKRYYPWWCDSGYSIIKEENIVWFETEEKTKSSGYELAENCK